MKQKLDKVQQCAVEHGEGPLLVTAGPGSGKTTVITHHIRYLINNLGIPPEEILVITFTKSAATEMRERFLKLMDDTNTKVVFGTFHAIFYQILRISGGFTHDSILKEKEKYIILRDILKAHKIQFYEKTFLEDLLAEISQFKNKGNTDSFKSSLLEKEQFCLVASEYQKRMESLNKIDFDDMVLRCHDLFLKDKQILYKWQKTFRYILVDEFQDINPMQYEIVKMLGEKHHNIFAVGDEDQSIYSFRGANPSICFQFLKDYPSAKQIFMATNYRCNINIVEGAKKLISHNKERFKKDICAAMNNTGAAEGLSIHFFNSEKEQYEEIAQSIKDYAQKGSLADYAVLFRTNMISPLFFSILKQYRIPYRMKVKCKAFSDNPVYMDIKAYFMLAKGERRRNYLYQIMNKPCRYITRDTVRGETFTWDGVKEYHKERFYVYEQLVKLEKDLEYIRNLPVFAALAYIRKGIGYEKWLKEQGGKNAQEGLEILEKLRILSKECETPEEMFELVEEAVDVLDTKDNDAIEVMTYHGAKGLEWPHVVLPDVLEGITPYKKAQTKEEIEEERRMFYVAVTRAKKSVLVCTQYKDEKMKKAPSVFVEELGHKKTAP